MNEKELIGKLRKFRQIKPRKDWVSLTKIQILGEEKQAELFPFFRLAYAGLFLFLILIGLVEFSQTALPGEPLYLLKRAGEKVAGILVPQEEKSRNNLELANKRLDELNEIAQGNEVKKLAPAISEFQANVSEAAKGLVNAKIDKNFVEQTKNLEDNKEKVEKLLTTKIDTTAYDNALAQLVEREIKELEGETLTGEQEIALQAVKKDFEAGNYSEALIKILDLSQR